MRNSIKIRVDFDFQGQHFQPELVLNLDMFFQQEQSLEALFFLLAEANGIGRYSYELEVMMSQTLDFSEPKGIAVQHFHDGQVNWQTMYGDWLRDLEMRKLETIAYQFFSVENLNEHPKLIQALEQAYAAGLAQGIKQTINERGWF